MLTIRRGDTRGTFRNDWLHSQHSFSFGEYHDPLYMGVSTLRVINDDRVIAGAGFPTHPHNNMEIVSYVLAGELAHKDSMGNGSVIVPGDVQCMSAGSGVTHSEFNPSADQGAHFLQIWLLPNARGIKPGYAQRYFAPEDKQGQLRLVVSPDGREGSLSAHTDTLMFASLLANDEEVSYQLPPDRQGYLHVAQGTVRIANRIANETLQGGDAATVAAGSRITLIGQQSAEVLWFDLPV